MVPMLRKFWNNNENYLSFMRLKLSLFTIKHTEVTYSTLTVKLQSSVHVKKHFNISISPFYLVSSLYFQSPYLVSSKAFLLSYEFLQLSNRWNRPKNTNSTF